MDCKGKKISVLGDSISTYIGYTETKGCFYGHYMSSKGGMAGVNDTWWMQVIHGLGGLLEKNNSFMGSCVTPGYGLGKSALERSEDLGSPEVILVFCGANDAAFSVPIHEFRKSYSEMIKKLKKLYPNTMLVCATSLAGQKVCEDIDLFIPGEGDFTAIEYMNSIRDCAEEEKILLVDMAKETVKYDAIDGAHPTKKGMDMIAGYWLKTLKDDIN